MKFAIEDSDCNKNNKVLTVHKQYTFTLNVDIQLYKGKYFVIFYILSVS